MPLSFLRSIIHYRGRRSYLPHHTKLRGTLMSRHGPACRLGLEGIVSKRIDSPYRSGRAKCWIKTKNNNAAAYMRVEVGTF